ncbi:Helix-turn-helix domain-containing protein [Desulfonispora thiosulfatigenes DSM 11270]|uniref:Helix-turn-helix domain-containing protein n=1 Tax=Desulfonispora thiosulfatigenes DSM 11270 TaxID=656914 RepID=A0A1W1V7Q1_DESTI|nr:winged helix-turn-helix domain-containing protein [Desulfonispora thiosulfatigenes]SMB89365.1 Helix-turn-helix domain-containing protein [Desulfonispora thiosulfatigenes DSM 11270]
MQGANCCMEDVLILGELEKIKTVSDPLRVKVLKILIQKEATVKQIADSLNQSSAKMHYHVKELEKQNLIKLVKTIEKGGILEKYYRAVAKNFRIAFDIS